MKKLIGLLAIAAIVSASAFAQDQKDAKHAEWDKKIKEELKLTPEQIQKYDALSTEYSGKISALQTDASLSKDAQKEKKKALKKEKEAKLFEFLTPAQQTKYKELMDKKKKE